MLSAFHTDLTTAQLRARNHRLGLEDVLRARRLLAGRVRATRTVSHPLLSRRLGCSVHVKLENSQALGSFKLRGWLSLLAQLPDEDRRRGIVSAPPNAHQRPLAAAARALDIRCTQVVSAEAAPALSDFADGELHVDGADPLGRADTARSLAERRGARFLEPSEEPAWIAGAGTVGLELLEQVGRPVDALFVPVGAGTLAAGIAIAVKSLSPHTRLVGVRAVASEASVASSLISPPSATAGVVLADLLDDCVTVSEAELHDAIRCYAETLRERADGAGAAALAGARRLHRRLSGQCIGVVLSGGNIDAATLHRVLRGEPTGEAAGALRELVGEMYL